MQHGTIPYVAAVLLAASVSGPLAQAQKADPRDAAVIEDCLKQERGKDRGGHACIGMVADPCLAQPEGKTTVGVTACFNREHRVWDDLLNRTYDELRKRLKTPQSAKLQDAQRAWIESRKQACEFYWEFFRGTLANPSAENCYGRETANRALYLQFFLDVTKK